MSDKQNVRLNSWKEIAAYLDHDVRTVIRWEKERGMPVYRVPGGKGHGIFAYSGEIDTWLHDGHAANSHPLALGPSEAQPAAPSVGPARQEETGFARTLEPGRTQASIETLSGTIQHPSLPGLVHDPATTQLPADAETRSADVETRSAEHVTLRLPFPRFSLLSQGALALIAVAIILGSVIFYFANKSHARDSTRVSSVSWKGTKLVALNARNETVWTYDFPRHQNIPAQNSSPAYIGDLDGDGNEEVLLAMQSSDANVVGGGEVVRFYCFSRAGKVLWEYTPEGELIFGAGQYGGPWGLTTWDVAGSQIQSGIHKISGETRITTASNHFTWWPSFLVVLDARGRVVDKFINSGWIYSWLWVERPQGPLLLVGGISNSNNCGMMAVLDGNHASGSSPEQLGSPYECKNCPPGRPLRYFVFPRSEINTAMGYGYNHVLLRWIRGGIDAHTTEYFTRSLESILTVDAIYDFSLDGELKRAYFSDNYWDLHRRLEFEGKITHSREQCPDRDGPRVVRAWDPKNGWIELQPPHG